MRENIRARDVLNATQLNAVRNRSDFLGCALVVHAWVVIALAAGFVAAFPNPFVIIIATMVIGSRQLGLVILMHDAAHGALTKSPTLNRFLGQWLCGSPMLADVDVYRRYHLIHHTRTLRDGDPDAVLTGHYPISRASLRRKLLRDLVGRSGYSQRRFQIANALGGKFAALGDRWSHYWSELGPATLANLVIAVLFATSGYGWLYVVCWLLPMLTWYQVVLRIRNIAEHAVVRGPDDPFGVARTTYVNWLERVFIAPYYVNYHLEHHLIMWVPCYRLQLMHRFLHDNGYTEQMQTTDGYLNVLREVTSTAIDGKISGGGGAIGSFGQGYG
ncbi:MAG: fatty acid desaturase [Gammaproteobacteria bacterium]|jgi:fatty acid desaturase